MVPNLPVSKTVSASCVFPYIHIHAACGTLSFQNQSVNPLKTFLEKSAVEKSFLGCVNYVPFPLSIQPWCIRISMVCLLPFLTEFCPFSCIGNPPKQSIWISFVHGAWTVSFYLIHLFLSIFLAYSLLHICSIIILNTSFEFYF